MCSPGSVQSEPLHAWLFPGVSCVKPQKCIRSFSLQLRNWGCSLSSWWCCCDSQHLFRPEWQCQSHNADWLYVENLSLKLLSIKTNELLVSPTSSWVNVVLAEGLRLSCKASDLIWETLLRAESVLPVGDSIGVCLYPWTKLTGAELPSEPAKHLALIIHIKHFKSFFSSRKHWGWCRSCPRSEWRKVPACCTCS